MLVAIGIILLLVWLFDYAVHLTAGSLIDLLLLFAAISFALDYLRGRGLWDRRPNWDHRPPKAYRRPINAISRWWRDRSRGSRASAAAPAKTETNSVTAGRS